MASMGRTKLAQEIIVEELRRSQVGRKELKKVVKAKNPSLTKHVKKALNKLIDAGFIVRDGKLFRIPSSQHIAENQSPSAEDDQVVPIAMRLRKENKTSTKSVKFAKEEVDIDDEIRQLEMELNNSDSSGDESDYDSADDMESDNATPAVLSLSAYSKDRIEHLPMSCLPEPGKYNPRGSSKVGSKNSIAKKKEGSQKVDGLKEAVQEVLNGYKARSSERLPFYCRFCAKQYGNEKEFFEHKNSDFHKTAVELERKATYCRLCLKQLTSPEQMKEHLVSRPHRERLQYVKSRQRTESGGKRQRDSSERQWI